LFLDMTFPEFEVAVKKTDIVLVPIGAIEQPSSHLPLATSRWWRSCPRPSASCRR
jgi:creatinine amidohydrolase/Fe(II)-dependent formamide hydrolase-like protein